MSKRPLTLIAALALAASLAACGGEDEADTAADNPDGSPCTYSEGGAPAKEADLPPDRAAYDADVPVTITTSAGEVTATLDAAAAPCAVNSFTSLAEQGYFDDTTCHRLTTQGIFVLQCGDPSGTGAGGPGYSFPDELTGSETYGPGTIAMANAGPDTNGSQFFLVYGDSSVLGPDYTVFGQMDPDGLAVVEAIGAAGTADGGGDGAPATEITINGVTVD